MSPDLPAPLTEMCVPTTATLRDVLAAIEGGGHEICFVLDPSQRVVGTLTDGDVRRALLAGHTLEETPAAEVMSRSFHWVEASGNHRSDALDAMQAHLIQQVPVLDDGGRLAGIHVIEEYLDRRPLPNWAVVLAGGRGTRLRPITEHVPKPMINVAGRPILERLVMGLVSAGIRRIFLSVNYKKEMVQEFFGDGSGHGCQIEYLEETTPLGTGGPLSLLPETPEHPLIHMNGDLVGDFQFRQLMTFHTQESNDVSVGVGLHRYEVPFGVVERDGGRISAIREKPPQHWWINYGIYAISPDVLPLVPRGTHYPITDLVQTCLDGGRRVGAFEMNGEWRDVGRPEDLAAVGGGPGR